MKDTILKAIENTVSTVNIDITTRDIALQDATNMIMKAPGFNTLSPAETAAALLSLSQQVVSRFNAGLAVNAGFVFNAVVKLYLGADAYFLDYLKQKTQTAHNKWQLSLGVAYIF